MLASNRPVEVGQPGGEKLYLALRMQRWLLLGTGLALALLLLLLQIGIIPGVLTGDSSGAAIGIYGATCFVAAAGVASWLVWTRIANTRTRSVILTPAGAQVVFTGGSTVLLRWDDPRLRLRLREFSDSNLVAGVTLEWASGGMGQYASVSRQGSARIKEEAAARGLKLSTSVTGAAPKQWTLTEITPRS